MARVLRGARCILWEADVVDVDGGLIWRLDIRNAEAVHKFIHLDVKVGRDNAIAFFRSKLPEDIPVMQRISEQAIRTGESGYQQEFRLRTDSGEILWFYEVVDIVPLEPGMWRLTGVCTDITERHHRQTALFDSEHRYRYLFEHNPHPMFVVDVDTFQYLDVNAAAVDRYGYSREEFLQMTTAEIRPPEDVPLMEASRSLFATKPAYHGVWRHRKKDGSIIDVELTMRDVSDSTHGGRSLRLVSAIDITEQLRSRRALAESEANLARAQLLANVGSWRIQGPNGPIWLSDQYYRIVGYEPGGFTPSWVNCLNCVHPDDQALVLDKDLKHRPQAGEHEIQLRVVRPSGDIRFVTMRFRIEVDASGSKSLIEGTIQDITEQKRADEEIKWKTACLEAQVHSSADGIIVVDNHEKVVLQNEKSFDIWEIPVEKRNCTDFDVQRQLMLTLIEDLGPVETTIKAIRKDPHFSVQDEIALKNGKVVERFTAPVIGVDGTYYGRLMSFRDLTERKRFEQAIRDSEASLRTMMESFPHIVWVCLPDFSCEYVNGGWSNFTGQPHSEAKDFGWLAPIHPADRSMMESAMARAVESPKPLQYEVRIRRADDSYRWFVVRAVPYCDAQGRVLKWFGSCTDIHDRIISERELEMRVVERTAQIERAYDEVSKAKYEAERANQAKNEFLSRMSHELRTPLNSIIGFGQLLEIQSSQPDVREGAAYILKSGRHLLELINEILDISRVESGTLDVSLERVSISALIGDTCSLLKPLAEEYDVALIRRTGSECYCFGLADTQRLRQVLLNLVSNAVKYNRSGGRVELSCRVEDETVLIEVRDTGPGLTTAQMERLFTPFDRLGAENTSVEGTGLGLVLTQRLVHAMGGALNVESRPAEGAVFTVHLKYCPDPSPSDGSSQEPVTPSLASELPKEPKTVLCVEDNPSNLRLFEVIFQIRDQIRLITAMQGSIALDLARKLRPNLILLDNHLPDMTGRDVLERLNEMPEAKGIPVIIVSADATSAQIERFMASGARAYVTKPINVEELLTLVDRLLADDPKPVAHVT
ncbi:MAG: PAS domain S-box protein [Fimbriimonas sp.]|nr:PAS domain S-box protein [Fimbriimonas sp.]